MIATTVPPVINIYATPAPLTIGNNHVSNVVTMSVVSMSLSFGIRSVGSLSLDVGALFRGEVFRLVASHLYFKT